MTRNSGRANNPSIQLKSMALVPPLSGGMTIQNFARNPVLVNNRLSAACYRTQTLASDLAKSPFLHSIHDNPSSVPRSVSKTHQLCKTETLINETIIETIASLPGFDMAPEKP